MGNLSHPPPADLVRIRTTLLSFLHGHHPDEKGYGRAQSAILEAAADYHWLVHPDDGEVIEAWKGFYSRVNEAYRPST